MDASSHTMANLFAQLGLAADADSIERFITAHSPLAEGILLTEAPFWTPAQSAFLKEEMLQDADWAPVIDTLNARLHNQQ